MAYRLISIALTTALLTMGAAGAGAAGADLKRVPSKGVTFSKKSGYWTECYYSGLGPVCETVYARVKGGKFKPVPVASAKLRRKAGQVQVCYWGSNNAEICYWAYSARKAK